MQYRIMGADKETGGDVDMTIQAASEKAALDLAYRKGIAISNISEVGAAPVKRIRSEPPPRLEQGHIQGAPVVNIATPRRGNSLGIAAIVLGTLAFLICWIPIVGLLGVPLAGLGLVLGVVGLIVALTRKGSSIGFPIAGAAVCALSLFVTISITFGMADAFNKVSAQMAKDRAKAVAPPIDGPAPTVSSFQRVPKAGSPLSAMPASPKVDKSNEAQAKRKLLIEGLIEEEVFREVRDSGVGGVYVVVTPRFMQMDSKKQGSLVSSVYDYYFDGTDKYAFVELQESLTKKRVGVYSLGQGGLKMD